MIDDVQPPPSKELYAPAYVGSKAKSRSEHLTERARTCWVERLFNEVIFSRNDSTYDVGR
jgi:hypothetical protein